MTDILFSTPSYFEGPFSVLEQGDLRSWLAKNQKTKRILAHCHGDWTRTLELFKWFAIEAKERGIQLVASVDSEEGLKCLLPLLSSDVRVEVLLQETEILLDSITLQDVSQLSLFLPLARPEAHPQLLNHALEKLSTVENVRIGVGWKNRMSGPLPIDSEEHEAWADAVLQIVASITKYSLRTGNVVRIEFSCGLKQCLFSTRQLGMLVEQNIVWPIATCPRKFVLFPGGNIQPCMRLEMDEQENVSSLAGFSDLTEKVDAWVAPYLGFCYQSEELNCRSLGVRSCSTGCVQHSMEEWH